MSKGLLDIPSKSNNKMENTYKDFIGYLQSIGKKYSPDIPLYWSKVFNENIVKRAYFPPWPRWNEARVLVVDKDDFSYWNVPWKMLSNDRQEAVRKATESLDPDDCCSLKLPNHVVNVQPDRDFVFPDITKGKIYQLQSAQGDSMLNLAPHPTVDFKNRTVNYAGKTVLFTKLYLLDPPPRESDELLIFPSMRVFVPFITLANRVDQARIAIGRIYSFYSGVAFIEIDSLGLKKKAAIPFGLFFFTLQDICDYLNNPLSDDLVRIFGIFHRGPVFRECVEFPHGLPREFGIVRMKTHLFCVRIPDNLIRRSTLRRGNEIVDAARKKHPYVDYHLDKFAGPDQYERDADDPSSHEHGNTNLPGTSSDLPTGSGIEQSEPALDDLISPVDGDAVIHRTLGFRMETTHRSGRRQFFKKIYPKIDRNEALKRFRSQLEIGWGKLAIDIMEKKEDIISAKKAKTPADVHDEILVHLRKQFQQGHGKMKRFPTSELYAIYNDIRDKRTTEEKREALEIRNEKGELNPDIWCSLCREYRKKSQASEHNRSHVSLDAIFECRYKVEDTNKTCFLTFLTAKPYHNHVAKHHKGQPIPKELLSWSQSRKDRLSYWYKDQATIEEMRQEIVLQDESEDEENRERDDYNDEVVFDPDT